MPKLLALATAVPLMLVMLAPRSAGADPSASADDDDRLYRCKHHAGAVAVTFKPETELKDLVTWVMGFTCKNFILDPRRVSLDKKVFIVAPATMDPDQAYQLFLTALSTMNLTVVPKGNAMRVVESQTAKAEALPIYKNAGAGATEQIVRSVVRPSYAQADTLRQAFATSKSDAGDIQVVGGMLVITDYASNVGAMMSLAKLIDVAGGSEGVYTIPVRHADATKLAQKLSSILNIPIAPIGATTAAPSAPSNSATTPTAEVPSRLLVDERTNTLIVAGSEAGYERVRALVDRLDIALDIDGGMSIHVYPLGSAIAEELAKTLNDAIQRSGAQAANQRPSGTTAPTPADGLTLEGQARVVAEKSTNKLIVLASGRDFLAIRDVIRELDQPRREVYIEALILEVAIGSSLDFGVSSHGGLPTSNGSSLLVGGVQMPDLKSLSLASPAASSLGLATGLIGGLVGGPLKNSSGFLGTSIPSYGLLLQALADQSNTNIVSAPSIIALDNEEAKYKVGTSIPYKKGITYGGLGTGSGSPIGSVGTNIDHKDLLLELDIKPHISTNDTVLLEVKHDSQDLGDKDADLGPSWTTRGIETRVVVRDQQTVVIGGLMQEKEVSSVTKVPLLGDIPVLGYLFRYTSKLNKKTNLLIMLTPYIIKDQLDLEAIRARKLREHDEFVQSFHALSSMKYTAKIDYTRKRGMVEEINRAVEDVEHDLATQAALAAPSVVESGPVERRIVTESPTSRPLP